MLRPKRRRKAISMTPLVDVIFLLLLFFMLSSTFSKFSEVELSAASGDGVGASEPPVFVQLFPDRLTVNGETQSLDGLQFDPQDGQPMLVALQHGVTAQRLTDLLVVLRTYPEFRVSVLGSS
ncbi:MAG: biopolymer transporter ExbD [Pseudomonadota bacterium]